MEEVLVGRISFRQFRVMVEHLPPGNAAARAVGSVWDDKTWLLHSIDSRLAVLNATFYNAHKVKDAAPAKPEFQPSPAEQVDPEAQRRETEYEARQRAELQAVLARPDPH
ncbi:hypothetical protein JTF08_13740 [Micrococcaceae bacterium RIT802]|nr:hypothetical protein [Micrococcaceae bacterium RIT 802]